MMNSFEIVQQTEPPADCTMEEGSHDRVAIGYGELDENGKAKFSWKRLLMFAGPGLLMSIAYVDPGNLESDLQTGFIAGYTLGWVILWSTVLGFTVQLMAMRVGVVTSKHLAEHCRVLYPPVPRTILWLMMEVAIVGSDIQEVIGSAIAIQLLSNGAVPLWGGVLITGIDTFFLLLLDRLGVRKLEAFFGILVATMTTSFSVMYFKADCPTAEVIKGTIVPTIQMDHMPVAMGIVGALVMPHNIFLHSALVQSRRIDLSSAAAKSEAILYNSIESALSLSITVVINLAVMSVFASGFHNQQSGVTEVGLSSAGTHLGNRFGPAMKYVWAIGLLAAGQSSTMTGTYTGQFVMSGFMKLEVSPWLRALITRSVALVPTLAVAVAYAGTSEMDVLNQNLNVLQSVQLPFALIPVLYASTRRSVMGADFAVKAAFRTLVQLISAMLLILNLSLVAVPIFSGVFYSVGEGIVVSSVAFLYSLFVLYLLIGPSATHRILSTSKSSVLSAINFYFGLESDDDANVGGLGGAYGRLVLEDNTDEDASPVGYPDALRSGQEGQLSVAEM